MCIFLDSCCCLLSVLSNVVAPIDMRSVFAEKSTTDVRKSILLACAKKHLS